MPLTRIDVTDAISSDRRSALADALHQAAMETIGITADNRHQVVSVHHADEVIADKRFMDLDRGPEQVFVQITLRRGRSPQAKRDLYARIAELAAANAGIDPRNILVSLVETDSADWSFGAGQAQLLDAEEAVSPG
jgi:phenylpyruvate tautomerase PptA (4-oxalocrotonate tautomerase family)